MFARKVAAREAQSGKTAKARGGRSSGDPVAKQETEETFAPTKFPWSLRNVALFHPAHGGRPHLGGADKPRGMRFRGSLPLLMQAKLEVGGEEDPLEREAAAVAAQVMRIPDSAEKVSPNTSDASPKVHEGAPAASVHAAPLHRKCDCGGTCDKCKAEQSGDEHGTVQRKLAAPKISRPSSPMAAGMEAPPVVHEVLRSLGRPLDRPTRAFFEPRFGYDFSRVRVHTDAEAAESARAVNALAYTVGDRIAFAAGRYTPRTTEGRRLLAHELAHVQQQCGNQPVIQRQAGPDDNLEVARKALADVIAGMQRDQKEDDEEDQGKSTSPLKSRATRPSSPSLDRFLPGRFTDDDIYAEYYAAKDRMAKEENEQKQKRQAEQLKRFEKAAREYEAWKNGGREAFEAGMTTGQLEANQIGSEINSVPIYSTGTFAGVTDEAEIDPLTIGMAPARIPRAANPNVTNPAEEVPPDSENVAVIGTSGAVGMHLPDKPDGVQEQAAAPPPKAPVGFKLPHQEGAKLPANRESTPPLSRPVAGFHRKLEPRPTTPRDPHGYDTNMPPARVMPSSTGGKQPLGPKPMTGERPGTPARASGSGKTPEGEEPHSGAIASSKGGGNTKEVQAQRNKSKFGQGEIAEDIAEKTGKVQIGETALEETGIQPRHLARIYEHHHALVQQLRRWFKAQGVNIDEFTIKLPADEHRWIHNEYKWNALWKAFRRHNPKATPAMIKAQMQILLKEFGLEGLPIVDYPT